LRNKFGFSKVDKGEVKMEKANYRDTIAHINGLFPDRVTITPQEAAQIMDCDIKTVYSSIARVKNPLPAVRMTRKKIVIPIPAFARWLS
jgi:hypothetical protein